ncbi:hypothetical protein COCC4DRAFT_130148, partial [Bipolaris maydis ATCC 48331]
SYISKSNIKSVIAAYPHKQWSGCFACTIEEELTLNPCAYSSAIPNFAKTEWGIKLMEPWDN